MTANIKTDQTEKRDDEKWLGWRDVDIVFADGSTGPAKAAHVGDGWCDVIAERDGVRYRLWVRASGEVDLPMNPCRLSKPWAAPDSVGRGELASGGNGSNETVSEPEGPGR